MHTYLEHKLLPVFEAASWLMPAQARRGTRSPVSGAEQCGDRAQHGPVLRLHLQSRLAQRLMWYSTAQLMARLANYFNPRVGADRYACCLTLYCRGSQLLQHPDSWNRGCCLLMAAAAV